MLQLASILKQEISVRIDETFNADMFKVKGWDIPANDLKFNRRYTVQ
jgi:hypothetical protein